MYYVSKYHYLIRSILIKAGASKTQILPNLKFNLLLPPIQARTIQDSDPSIDIPSEFLTISTSTLTLFPLAQHEKRFS